MSVSIFGRRIPDRRRPNRTKHAILTVSHISVLLVGFAAGIYILPILTAPPAPETDAVSAASRGAMYSGSFRRELRDSDPLHWGEGKIWIGRERIVHVGKLAPGPDYKLYLSPQFVETEADFKRLKPLMVRVADVKSFNNFIVEVPANVDVSRYAAVIVWCESFGQFITAASYK